MRNASYLCRALFAKSVLAISCATALDVALAQTQPGEPTTTEIDKTAPQVPAAQKPGDAKPDAAPQAVEKIEVTGKNSATNERRNSTAAKIIITKEDIAQYGDSTIAEVMRRLPGVTQSGRPGRGGPIAMRGMGGGYTQILIDGQRMAPGFTLDQLQPEQVERIEILRAPTAETGARAVAGTINIVLREPIRKTDNEFQAGVTWENGVYPARVSFTHNDTFGEKGTWVLSANGDLRASRDESKSVTRMFDDASGALKQENFAQLHSDNTGRGVFVNLRGQWNFGPGEQFGMMAFAGANQPDNLFGSTLNQTFGTRPAPYATREGSFQGSFEPSRIALNLNRRLDPETRYEVRGSVGRFYGESHNRTNDFDRNGGLLLASSTDTISRDNSWNVSGKLMRNVGGGKHSLTAGTEIEGVERKQTSITLNNGVQQLLDIGEEFNAGSQRFAIYVQDEWELAESWSANLGARYETIRLKSKSKDTDANNISKVLSPLGHVVWRLDPQRRDQIRLSLTQSYKPPNIDQVIARPALNTTYPVPGANTIVTPDRAGNPNLKPERANGIDLAYEMYFKSGGVFSVNLFHRQIKDLIRNVPTLETVSWAPVPRYVSRPQNFSEAFSQGIEFDTKFTLPELIEGAPPVNFRINTSVFRSQVKDVIGPNNRISEQPKAIANFGGDYRIRAFPLTIGGNIAWTPGYTLRTTNFAEQTLNLKRVADVYAVWTVSQNLKFRLTGSNVAPSDTLTETTTIANGERINYQSDAKNYRSITLRLETKF